MWKITSFVILRVILTTAPNYKLSGGPNHTTNGKGCNLDTYGVIRMKGPSKGEGMETDLLAMYSVSSEPIGH
jgi:hypothetical protein